MKISTIEALEDLVCQWPQDSRLESLHQASMYPKKEPRFSFFYHLVKLRTPRISLELGCSHAIVSAYMCAAADKYGGHVIGIDKTTQYIPSQVLPELFDNFHYLVKDSTKAGPDVIALVERFGPIGVVWQDSSHLYNESVMEWDIYSQMLDKRAIWVCDDITLRYPEDANTPGIWGYWIERPGLEKKVYWQPSPFRGKGADIGVILL